MNSPALAQRVARMAAWFVCLGVFGCTSPRPAPMTAFQNYVLDFDTPCDPEWQARVEAIDAGLRQRHGLSPDDVAVGVLDLLTLRLALIRPDAQIYAASVPKIGILLA